MNAPARLLVLAALAAAASCRSAHADPPRQPPDASTDSSLEDEPQPTTPDGGRPPWVPAEAPELPSTPSPAPERAEWATAPLAPEVRITDPGCKARRIREHYRIDCSASHVAITAGDRKDVAFGREMDGDFARDSWMTFPVRRGDRRVGQFFAMTKWAYVSDTIVSVQWLDGDPAPMITVIGISR